VAVESVEPFLVLNEDGTFFHPSDRVKGTCLPLPPSTREGLCQLCGHPAELLLLDTLVSIWGLGQHI